jgi:hypothetical protein
LERHRHAGPFRYERLRKVAICASDGRLWETLHGTKLARISCKLCLQRRELCRPAGVSKGALNHGHAGPHGLHKSCLLRCHCERWHPGSLTRHRVARHLRLHGKSILLLQAGLIDIIEPLSRRCGLPLEGWMDASHLGNHLRQWRGKGAWLGSLRCG